MKFCPTCKENKSETDFYLRKLKTKIGYSTECKLCNCKRRQRRYDLYERKPRRSKSYADKLAYQVIYQRQYRQRNKEKLSKYHAKYNKQRKVKDSSFKLLILRRTRRYSALKHGQYKNATLKDLGCFIMEWKTYLETKFDSNMTWENYGSYWHLDEIIPCSAWDLSNPIEQQACFHYLNSQPLEKNLNLTKSGVNREDYTEKKQQFLMILRALDIICW